MDRQKLAELIAKIDAVCKSQDKETVLTLDEYFDGNTEEHSTLCANTGKPPSSEELWRFLRGIQDKKEVSQVLVRVYDYCDAISPYHQVVELFLDSCDNATSSRKESVKLAAVGVTSALS